MHSAEYQLLPFDSELFEFKVAKILLPQLDLQQLEEILGKLREHKVKLAYWGADYEDKLSQEAAKALSGVLGSVQITYVAEHKELILLPVKDYLVEEYTDSFPSVELKLLAFQAGNFSHFKMDEKFPEELFFRLYKQWITNSVKHKVADQVLVVRRNNAVVGMITVGEKNTRGDIGLLAVQEEFRGQKIGETLVKAAQAHFVSKGLEMSQVVTQQANSAACHLYEKCGYHIEKIQNFYHFWL